MKPSKYKYSLSVESCRKLPILLRCRKMQKNHQRYQFKIVKAQIGDLNAYCVKISRSHLLYFPNNKPSKSVTVGLGRFGLGQVGPVHHLYGTGWFCDFVILAVILGFCLFVRYRNPFPVVQFQNQAHIRNPYGTG